jgi:alpha,alpha-trehalase
MKMAHANKLPSALEEKNEILERLKKGRPAIFLDYDGTLTPTVEDPAKALMPERTRQLVEKLAERWTVVIMTGRALYDVKNLVGLENLVYAGSHGFKIAGPEESFHEERGVEYLPSLNKAERELKDKVKGLKGVRFERKSFAIAVHYRQASEEILPELEKRMKAVAEHYPDLVETTGKKIFELRPKTNWDKGKALLYLLGKMHIDDSRTVPLYIGDGTTDEDAFQAVADRGIGILVSENSRPTAASYIVRDPGEVTTFLEELVNLAEKETSTNVWSLTYETYEPEAEKLREALCTTGNGYFAARGAAPESAAGETHYPGTYLAGIYNRLKSEVAGHTIENESLVNIPNWLPLTFRIESGDWFDIDSVRILEYRQDLDMRRGVLVREVRFEDDKKRRTRLTQRRFAHMHFHHLAALETVILPENWLGTIRVRSALDGRVDNTLVERYRQLDNHHLDQVGTGVTDDDLIWLEVETNQSHVRIAEAARTRIFYKDRLLDINGNLVQKNGYIAREFNVNLETGQAATIEKITSLYHSRDPGISESLIEALDALRHAGNFTELLERHDLAWRHLWERWQINIEIESRRAEQILNLHIFHLLQTVSPNTVGHDVGVPPRGLHGEAYRGLIMWDELFIFPLLNLRMPDITRSLLMYRYNRLSRAYWAAKEAGYSGAMFPWQSGSDGQEQAQTFHLNPQSGRWIPDNSQLERHINIAIAYNIWQYYQVTGDMDFLCFYGAELIIGMARFWASKARFNEKLGRYEICKVMGPDEFHERYPGALEPGVDNNAYTNVMVSWVFCRALEILDLIPGNRRKFLMEDLAVTQEELESWDKMSRKMRIVFHGDGIISQFEGYGDLEEFDWDGYRKKYKNIQRLDRILEAEEDSPNRYKLSKQADVLMLFYLLSADELGELFERLGYDFKYETIPNNVEYYLARTSHGSTLSRVVHAWVMARSKRELSWRLFQDALESDIEDIQGGTTREGIHLGAMAGTVDLILRCYSGVEHRGDLLRFNPQLPSELKSIQFSISYRGSWLDTSINRERIKIHYRHGHTQPLKIAFADSSISLSPGETRELRLSTNITGESREQREVS